MAKMLFSSLISEGTSKMLQSSSRIESTESRILPINIKLQQGNCHPEAPNYNREGRVGPTQPTPQDISVGSLLAICLAISLVFK